jgi:hypothetical protein
MELVGNLYSNLSIEFAKVIDQLNIGYEDKRKRRHVYTLHSLRRYVRTLISDLGYQDFAIWTIGHASSTYWRKSEKEKYALFKKIEPHLLLLDQTALSRRHADTQSRLETMEQENRGLQEKYEQDIKSMQDKMNHIMEMIQDNPKLAHVKPEVLVKKNKN